MRLWTVWRLHHFNSDLGVKLYILKKIPSVAIHNSSSDQQGRSQQTLHPSALAYRAGLPAEQRRVQGRYPEIQSVLQDWPHLPVRPPSPSLTTTSRDSHVPPNSESASKQARRSWVEEMTFGGAGCGLRTFFPQERKINSLANFSANLIFPAEHPSIISSNKAKIL